MLSWVMVRAGQYVEYYTFNNTFLNKVLGGAMLFLSVKDIISFYLILITYIPGEIKWC